MVVQRPVELPRGSNCAVIQVADTRQALAYISSRYFNMPSRKLSMIAACGAAGKQTFSYLLYNFLRRKGEPCGMIKGMETLINDSVIYQSRNHPGALEIQEAMDLMQQNNQRFGIVPAGRQDILLERVRYIAVEVGVLLNTERRLRIKKSNFIEIVVKWRSILTIWPHLFWQSKLDHRRILTFGLSKAADVRAENVGVCCHEGVVGTCFDVLIQGKKIFPFSLISPALSMFTMYWQ